MIHPFSARSRFSVRPLILTGMAALLVAGCGKGDGKGASGPGGMFGGPASVAITTVQPETLPLMQEYTAQIQGSREVEVRARVTGILLKRNYSEGAAVKAGQSLFTIDPAPFLAAQAMTAADVAAAEARYAQARREATRIKPLIESRAVSQKEFDDAVSAESIAAADLQAAKARLKEAQLNLGWTHVESPITGVTSRSLKSEGSLVSGPDVLLTTVTQVNPAHVLFGISDNDRLKLQREVEKGRLRWPQGGRFKVTVKLADGSEYAKTGMTDFNDIRISQDTGTSEARAEIPNPDGLLHSGEFVRVRLEGAMRERAFKVPQRAVLEGPQGKFVFVVGKDSKAEMRNVDAGEWNGQDVIVTNGLKAGDQVIVDGLLKLGPGAPVKIDAAPKSSAPAGEAQAAVKKGG